MSTLSQKKPNAIHRHSQRRASRLRQAAARRRLQELRDDEALRSWLTEVWDESPSLAAVDPRSRVHYNTAV